MKKLKNTLATDVNEKITKKETTPQKCGFFFYVYFLLQKSFLPKQRNWLLSQHP